MNTHVFTIGERSITSRAGTDEEVVIGIHIGDHNFITIRLTSNENGDLDYEVYEDANPDVGFQGTYPEYFDIPATTIGCDPDKPVWDVDSQTWSRVLDEDQDNDIALFNALAGALNLANRSLLKEKA